MPDKSTEFWTALAYAIVAISGASGGCLVVAHRAVIGQSVTGIHLLAYAFIGGVMSVAGMAALVLLGVVVDIGIPFEQLLLAGLLLGVTGCLALASANLSIRFILRRLGIEVDVNIKRIGSD